MITPMTNIEQSVGRILRQKHEFAAVVVDIIDTHDNFQRQWAKRKQFYKKQNYKIIQTNSTNYDPDIKNWNLIYKPTECKKITKTVKEKIIVNSRSSSEKSIANDTEDEEEEEEEELEEELKEELKEELTIEPNNDKLSGVCFLKFKK